MGAYKFVASSIAVFFIMNTLFVFFPEPIEQSTGIDTSSLQKDTDISGSVDSNVSQTGALDQAGQLTAVYSQPDTSNRALTGMLVIYTFLMIAIIFDWGWIG